MKPIPKQRKEAILAKMSAPDSKPLSAIAAEEGISIATLYAWRKLARASGYPFPEDSPNPSESRSSQEKFNIVLHTASLDESQLSEYCRSNGLYPEQITRWRTACSLANDPIPPSSSGRSKLRKLEKELRRKEKALAEAAALLVLSKKAAAIWGEEVA